MAAVYCYEGIPLRFLASLFDIQMRYLVYMRYLWHGLLTSKISATLLTMIYVSLYRYPKDNYEILSW